MQIFTVGIGTPNGELIRVTDERGHSDYIRDEDGNVVKSHLNEELLKDIAKESQQGVYFRLQGARTMEELYTQYLSKLPKSEHEEKLVRRYHERYHWPLALAFAFLAAEMLFPERRRESKKRVAAAPNSLKVAAAVLLLLAWPGLVHGSTTSALRDYKEGKYSEALKQYEELLQSHKDDPRLHFNAGAAAYRAKNFEQAAKEFDAALAASDLKLQELSYYNRGNARFRLGEQIPDPSQRTEAWKSALKDFESSMKLNPQDTDAKHNYQFVKKKLEEQQQQQQQQKKDKSDKNQNQDQQQQQQKQEQKNQDSKKDQEQQQSQSGESQKKEENKQNSEQSKNQEQKSEQQQKQQQAKEKEQQEKQQQANKASAEEKSDEQREEQAAAAGQMTPEQARQLLDAQKSEEHLLPIQPEKKPIDRSRRFKDW